MKAKLLKKIRKRFSIVHYPEGLYIMKQFYKGPVTALIDNEDCYYTDYSFKEKQESFDELFTKLQIMIQRDYGTFRSARKKPATEVLWHKTK
jgi:hypothetical protein